MELSLREIDYLESWWITQARESFLAYRMYMRDKDFEHNWFIDNLCNNLQQFYVDLMNGERPILILNTPPQHGKSWTIGDFISWVSGKVPELRTIYATFSDMLGKRCNLQQQRFMDSEKYSTIFPDVNLAQKKGLVMRNTEHLEFVDADGNITNGQFRNTTTGGRINGESLDLGVIDDAVKGRKEAESITVSQTIWEWYTDDFNTRFSKSSGLILIMTRWTTHDIVARVSALTDKFVGRKVTWINYPAIATKDEEHRKEGEPLFPELKPLEFLQDQKATMLPANWEAVYQGSPTVKGGNKVKDDWWAWWKTGHLPPLRFKFITADTAQKIKTQNDWTVFQAWGYGIDDNIYLLDKVREKFEAPTLRKEAQLFYNKHNQPKKLVTDPVLRGMFIEDKSSGTGLIQEMRKLKLKVVEVPRNTDKILRCDDASPEIEAGRVYLNVDVPDVANLTKESREFPNSEFDDDFDTLITAIEVAFINKKAKSSLQAAMEAD